ncbi:hypothetical protein WNY78_04470 [Psychroserpens sp. AS72]|uniref:hypothetical protein n=1 Tax=Psychroserpens sp. AS72 TaxID=3135775 RepID=UPI00316B4ED9
MKNLKLAIISVLFIACCFTSCTNNEPVVEEQNIQESTSITTSLAQLRTQFDSQGDVLTANNLTGNIVLDFCFDFVYPLNLSYNNGVSVTVNNLDDLIEVMINSTNNLYIDGIEFPFNVEVYSETENAIVVTTINNEEEFMSLVESCDFDNNTSCECYEVYDPVCVDITAPDGVTFLVTYPNACYAECDGFTEADFAENCQQNYNYLDGTDCFTFNFPIDIITDNNETVTINSQEELNNTIYNSYYFEFVYSFDITYNDGTLLSIGNEEAFIALLEYCFDGGCPCPAVVIPVCVEVVSQNGNTEILTFLNACEAECAGFTEADFVECEMQQGNCDAQVVTQYLAECTWLANTSLQNNILGYEFNTDGTLIITTNTATDDPVNGTWSIITDEQNGNVYIQFYIPEPYGFITNLEWTVTLCEEELIHLESGNESIIFERDCDFNNPSECSEQEIFGYLLQCNWYINTSLYNTVNAEYAQFYQDGSVEIYSDNGTNQAIDGTWWLTSNPSQGFTFMSFNIPSSPHEIFSEYDWFVTQCSEDFILLESGDGNEFIQLARECD